MVVAHSAQTLTEEASEMPEPIDKFECLKAIFGAHYARQLSRAGYRELLEACDQLNHALMADMAPPQRERLKAILDLCRLYYPEQDGSPEVIAGIGDVVRLIQPRVAHLYDRVVWLLCLDASGALTHEVLVQVGGDAQKPPVLRTILRHALFKGAVSAWIADFRPVEQLAVPPDTSEAFAALVTIGAAIGIEFCDWVIFGSFALRSVRDVAPVETTALLIDREAA